MTRIGYAVMGRIMKSRGDDYNYSVDEITLLERLARAHREVDFVWVSPTSDHVVDEPNVSTDWIGARVDYHTTLMHAEETAARCDGLIVFLTQHTQVAMRMCIPKLDGSGEFVKPLQQAMRSVAPVVHAVNMWQHWDRSREPVYVANDPRCVLKCRDLAWPPRQPILSQWRGTTESKHYRFGDTRPPHQLGYEADDRSVPGHWVARHTYEYMSLELVAKTLEA